MDNTNKKEKHNAPILNLCYKSTRVYDHLAEYVTQCIACHAVYSLVSTDNFSLTKSVRHKNFGNEFAFILCKDYLYYLARLPLSQMLGN